MRWPARSVERLPGTGQVRAAIRPILLAFLAQEPSWQHFVHLTLVNGKAPEATPAPLGGPAGRRLLLAVTAALRGLPRPEPWASPFQLTGKARPDPVETQAKPGSPASSSLRAHVFAALAHALGDPDDCLARWITQGAPLGATYCLERTGVFPPPLGGRTAPRA